MPDARFPDRWLNDRRVLRLSGDDFRSFVVALTWSVSNRTDGRIESDDLPFIPGFRVQSISALTAGGLWTQEADFWLIADYDATQTSKAQLDGLDHKRHLDRERQARKRARDHGQEPSMSRDIPRDVTHEVARDTKARLGQDRTGSSKAGAEPDPWDQLAPVSSVPSCLEPGCPVHLRGIELGWGKCRPHHRGGALDVATG